MKLTLQLQLLPTSVQAALLITTMRRVNEAASFAAKCGFDAKVFSQPSIHKLAYFEIRKRFGLSAQLAVRAIGKAVECFSRDKTVCPVFRPDGAITYDQRNLSFKGLDKVSLATILGRQIIGLVYGEYQRERFDRIKGQCDLIRRQNKFYLIATVDLPEAPPIAIKDFIGVDMGIVRIATTDDGTSFSGAKIDAVRERCIRARQTYQRRDTRSARRRLRKMGKRQSRFQKGTNHVISKQLVALAKGTGRGIAIEELTGIRERITVRHKQRSRFSNWSFAQLRALIAYKAKLAGVPLVVVDPRNTSKACSRCGHCDKGNRKDQGHFECLSCGYAVNADQNGACNIRLRALGLSVKQPDLVATPEEHSGSATFRWL